MNQTFEFDRQLRAARTLLGTGQLAKAVPILTGLAALDPKHVEVRNALAVAALIGGDFAGARLHVTAALASAPNDALTLNQLAQLQQAEGDLDGALQTYRRLLSQHPSSYASRLAFARLLETCGDDETASLQYFRAMRDAQQSGRWLSAESTPPSMRVAVAHAGAVVKRYRQELCDRIVGPLAGRFGVDALQRVSRFVEIQMGDAIYAPADDRQRPSGYPFPGLPQAPYLDKSRIAGIRALEAQTPAILSELKSVLSQPTGQESVFATKALADEFLHNERRPAVWDGFYFYRHGARNVANAAACPLTMAAIDQLPLSIVPGHGPEVVFSILGPGTHLLPHYGVTNVRVVGHLPLIVPSHCALRVAGIEHHWRVGEVVVFDDTYSHEAWNRSDEVRVVMIFDMWHPDLTEVERLAMKDLQATLGGFSSRATQLDAS